MSGWSYSPNATFGVDVYTFQQASATSAPTPAALPSGAYLAVAISDGTNFWNLGGWTSKWGMKLTLDPNNSAHYTFQTTRTDVPNPVFFTVVYIDADGKDTQLWSGDPINGTPTPLTASIAYTIGASAGSPWQGETTTNVQQGGTTPTPQPLNADAFPATPPRPPAPSFIQWIHDAVWGIMGEV